VDAILKNLQQVNENWWRATPTFNFPAGLNQDLLVPQIQAQPLVPQYQNLLALAATGGVMQLIVIFFIIMSTYEAALKY
jgi:hypothetical protein